MNQRLIDGNVLRGVATVMREQYLVKAKVRIGGRVDGKRRAARKELIKDYS